MEGIMMRGPHKTAMAVRDPEGVMIVEDVDTKTSNRPVICKWPVIRGIFGFIDSLTLGYKCLMRSAEIAGLEDIIEDDPKKKEKAVEADHSAEEASKVGDEKAPSASEEKKLPSWTMTVISIISVVLAFGLAFGLFFFLPTFLYGFLESPVNRMTGGNTVLNSLIKSVFEGVLKIMLLVGYMAAISFMKDIRRTYMYHGAEHKTIFCLEAGLDLTVENVRKMGRFHPRCGTSFLILMLLVGIFISFFIDPLSIAIAGRTMPTLLRVVVRVLLIPLIMGVGYELIKFAGRHNNVVTRIISAPGVALQHLTVLEPTDDMIECAIAAVKRVLPESECDKSGEEA